MEKTRHYNIDENYSQLGCAWCPVEVLASSWHAHRACRQNLKFRLTHTFRALSLLL